MNLLHLRLARIPLVSYYSPTPDRISKVLRTRTLDYAEYIFNIFLIVVFFSFSLFSPLSMTCTNLIPMPNNA